MSADLDDDAVIAGLLSRELRSVVEELHAIDPVDLVSYVRFGSFAAIDDLLQSSTELFFKEGTLTFGWRAGVDLRWGDLPSVTLGMEFNHRSVSVFFNLCLGAFDRLVEVCGVMLDPECSNPLERLAQISAALTDAHVVPVHPGGIRGPSRPTPGLPYSG